MIKKTTDPRSPPLVDYDYTVLAPKTARSSELSPLRGAHHSHQLPRLAEHLGVRWVLLDGHPGDLQRAHLPQLTAVVVPRQSEIAERPAAELLHPGVGPVVRHGVDDGGGPAGEDDGAGGVVGAGWRGEGGMKGGGEGGRERVRRKGRMRRKERDERWEGGRRRDVKKRIDEVREARERRVGEAWAYRE